MFTVIITDCKADNESGRQIARFNSLDLGPSNLIGVESTFGEIPTIEASANLIDVLDATDGRKGVVVVNVAPRGNKKNGENGNYFCYFYHKETLVISSTVGHTLFFVKIFDICKKINILDTAKVLNYAYEKNLINKNQIEYISRSQFRSFDFVPLVARWLTDNIVLPTSLSAIPKQKLPHIIWCIDAFGNCKLTITNKDQKIPNHFNKKGIIRTNLGNFVFYERLKDVPKGKTAVYIGSSGIDNIRFLEIAAQGIPGSAADKLNLNIGDKIQLL